MTITFRPDAVAAIPRLHDIGVALAVVVTVCYLARLYTKLAILKRFRADDIALLISFILYVPMELVAICSASFIDRVAASDGSLLREVDIVMRIYNVAYALCAIACKASLGLLVLSILHINSRWRKGILGVVIIIFSMVGLTYTGFSFTCGFTAMETLGISSCPPYTPAGWVDTIWSSTSVVVDVTYAGICLSLIWEMSMTWGSRLVGGLLLCLGSVAAIVSVFRLLAVSGWGSTSVDGMRVQLFTWSLLEIGICIAANSLAAIRPLLTQIQKRRVFARFRHQTQDNAGDMFEPRRRSDPLDVIMAGRLTGKSTIAQGPAIVMTFNEA